MTIDKRAIEALLPFLSPSTPFAEPCAGEGHIVSDLEIAGHPCMWISEIDPKYGHGLRTKDAFTITSQDLYSTKMIITNPPWSRNVLHRLIQHFASLKPTWLLFDLDWCATKQSAQLMDELCTDIVVIGRLKWIPNTNVSGKDNAAWYKFDNIKSKETIFHGRQYSR